MNANKHDRVRHLRLEELEVLAMPGDRRLPARSSAHAAECARCLKEAEELRALHGLLQALASLQPMVGFSDRVMRRIRLPVPWRVRVLETIRAHRVTTTAALAGVVAAFGVGFAWVARYPELTPMTVATFIVEHSTALLWGAVMDVGRLVYGTGIVQTAEGIAGQLTVLTAFVAVATVTLVGLASLRIMLSLMDVPTGSRPASAG
jgi:hypothetical protein